MDTHTQNSILGKIYILVVEHCLITLWIDTNTTAIDKIWKSSPENRIGDSHLTLDNLLISKLLIYRFEVTLEKLIILLLIVLNNSLHVVGRESPRKDMNKSKGGFKGFVHEMGEVILNLLGSLDINKVKSNIG